MTKITIGFIFIYVPGKCFCSHYNHGICTSLCYTIFANMFMIRCKKK